MGLATASPSSLTLTWRDEFDGNSLDRSKWRLAHNYTHCFPPDPCAEHQLYVDDAVRVAGGRLQITTTRASVVGPKGSPKQFTSGWIDSNATFAQQYGRFAANCSLPSRDSTSIWPAFWLLPQFLCWPTGGEVDIFEFGGNGLEDEIFGSYHWGNACSKDKFPIPGKGYRPPGSAVDWQTGWHVYALEWTPDALEFYVDDELYFTRPRGPVAALPQAPMYMILNQAVGGVLGPPSSGSYPATLQVEWVRVYSNATV